MGYAIILPVNEVSEHQNLWLTAEYGLLQRQLYNIVLSNM